MARKKKQGSNVIGWVILGALGMSALLWLWSVALR